MKIIFFAAMTLNAKIAHAGDELVNWTSKEDKQFFNIETRKCGVVVMGNSTYKTMGRALPGRLNIVTTRSPDIAKNVAGELEFTDVAPQAIVEDLRSRGFENIAVIGGAHVFTEFLAMGLADELAITIEPKIFSSGVNILHDLPGDVSLKLLEVRQLNEAAVLLRYEVVK